ncbi:hypothetical protein ACFSC4_14690 [Deinococcus malanensis]|uniref:hypothetical protein n=1 Tax=Deinococcus malanensis TaxID=1706855 RepID=UPI0036454E2B
MTTRGRRICHTITSLPCNSCPLSPRHSAPSTSTGGIETLPSAVPSTTASSSATTSARVRGSRRSRDED